MKYFVPAGRITNKGMPQRERKCFVVKKTVWKLFAPALCAAVLFAVLGEKAAEVKRSGEGLIVNGIRIAFFPESSQAGSSPMR